MELYGSFSVLFLISGFSFDFEIGFKLKRIVGTGHDREAVCPEVEIPAAPQKGA